MMHGRRAAVELVPLPLLNGVLNAIAQRWVVVVVFAASSSIIAGSSGYCRMPLANNISLTDPSGRPRRSPVSEQDHHRVFALPGLLQVVKQPASDVGIARKPA